MFFNKERHETQEPKIDGLRNKAERICSSGAYRPSVGNVEAGFGGNTEVRKPRFNFNIMKNAAGRRDSVSSRRSFGDWISSPRAIFGSMALGVIVIIILFILLIDFRIKLRHEISDRSLSRAEEMRRYVTAWANPSSQTHMFALDAQDFSRGITPIPCHSHNDYWRTIPLYEALAAGCTGVEADVWLTDDKLLVGHTENSLTPAHSLNSLYLDPIMTILTHQNTPTNASNTTLSSSNNGVFETSPKTSLTLLIDMKTAGEATLPAVLQHLEPLRSRGWLTYFNGTAVIPGPVTVVGTGNTPFSALISNNTYRDIFFDAPLDQFWGENVPSNNTLYTSSNSYYSSVSFAKSIGKLWHGVLTPQQVDIIRGQVKAAEARGLKARYWDAPSWPLSVRDHVWDVLEKEGVGMLNVDDVNAASQRKWGG